MQNTMTSRDFALSMVFRLVDYEFTVRCDSDETAWVIGRLLAQCRVERASRSTDTFELLRPPGPVEPSLELVFEGQSLARSSPGIVVDQLLAEISRRSFTRGNSIFVHAGVAARDGVGVLLPGAPGRGKSTTVAGLVRAGFDFLTDEVAAFDLADGTVRPFPRPLMLSGASLRLLPGLEKELPVAYEAFRSQKHRMAPDDLRPGALGAPCRIAFIVSPSYVEDSVTCLDPMDRPEALRLLVEQSFNLERSGGEGFRALADVVRNATCYRLTIGNLASAVGVVRELFAPEGA